MLCLFRRKAYNLFLKWFCGGGGAEPMRDSALCYWWLVWVTLVVDWLFLPQNEGPLVGTYKGLLRLCECKWGRDSTCRWWGHLNTTCYNRTRLNFLHWEVVGEQKTRSLAPSHPLAPSCSLVPSCPLAPSCDLTCPHALSPSCPLTPFDASIPMVGTYDWLFLPQNFGPIVGTYKGFLQLCECKWGGDSTCRWWGHLNTTCYNWTCLNFLHWEVVGNEKLEVLHPHT